MRHHAGGRDRRRAPRGRGRAFARAVLVVLTAGAAAAPAPAASDRRTPVVEAVEKALPSVVNIGTERLVKILYSDPQMRFRDDLFDRFFSSFFGVPPPPGYRTAHSLGSGVIVDPQGYILTNHHVIQRASHIRVTLADESDYEAVVVASDELNDLALIKIKPLAPLRAIEFGADDDLLLGETVIVLGNPFGLSHTVTVGVLSAKNREATYEGEVLYRDILQTDAAVNPGSSGGPLLNVDGELIGVNVAVYQEAQNIGFAIPVKRVRDLLARWFTPRFIKKLWTGVAAEEGELGLKVTEVDEGSPAAAADLQAGDVIRSVDGRPAATLYDFNTALLPKDLGDAVALEVERAGEPRRVELVLAALPKPSGELLGRKLLGLEFGEREAVEGGKFARFRKGLPIVRVAESSASGAAGLKPGFLVTRIGEFEIQTLDDVGLALENVRSGDPVALVIVSVDERGSFIVAQSTTVQVKAD